MTSTSRTSETPRSLSDLAGVKDDGPPTGGPPIAGGPQNAIPVGTGSVPLATPTDSAIPSMAETSPRGLLNDDASSSDDNVHGHSTSSSPQGTCQFTAQSAHSLYVPS